MVRSDMAASAMRLARWESADAAQLAQTSIAANN
jgi:hypothetical protein